MMGLNQRGFTLLEIIIASVLLLIICAGTLSSFHASSRFLLFARYRLEAMEIARSQLESQAALAYDNLVVGTTVTLLPTGTRTTTITNDPLGLGADYRGITVSMQRVE